MEFQIKDKEWAENFIVKRMLEMQDREDTKRFIHEVLIINNVAVGDSQEFQEVSRPVSWRKDYLTGS